jgi:hypothetical protein
MAVTQLDPPDDAKRAFLEGLGEDDPQLLFSAPVFSVSLETLRAADADKLRPKLLGWQFVAKDSKGRAVSGEVAYPSDEIATSLTRGKNADDALAAFLKIKEESSAWEGQFELRRLRLSPLRIDALWLASLPSHEVLSAKDRLYPFTAFQAELRSRLLQAPEFLKFLRNLAEKKVASVKPSVATRREQ